MEQVTTNVRPQLLKVSEAAGLLRVSTSTVHNWIATGSIPYIRLPAPEGRRADYRIPLRGLIDSLAANYDLAGDLDELVGSARGAGVSGDDVLSAGGGEPEALDSEH